MQIDWDQVMKDLNRANYFLLFFVFLLDFLARAEITYKWNLLLRVRGIYITFIRLYLVNAVGTFWLPIIQK